MAKNNNARKLFIASPQLPSRSNGSNNSYGPQLPSGNTGPKMSINIRPSGALGKVHDVIEKAAPGYQQQLAANAANNAIQFVQNRMGSYDKIPMGKPKGNSGNPGVPIPDMKVFTKSASGSNISYALSRAPIPKSISLNSGIKPNTYVRDYLVPIANTCSPMHMSHATLQIPTSGTNPLSDYFTNEIIFAIQTRAQANISFSLDIQNIMSTANISNATNASITALNVYFFFSSILSYESDARNNNSGMIALRKLITAQMLSDLSQLGRKLQDTPIPPRVVEWVRYMNGNFLSSNNPGAALIKFYPDYNFVTGAVSTSIGDALNGLNSAYNTNVYAIMRRTMPKWRVGTLFDCPPIPMYSSNFCTIFNNSPSTVYVGGSLYYSNTAVTMDTAIPYNTCTNRLDGAAYAMSGVFNSVEFYPGLIRPFVATATTIDSKISYYNTGAGGIKWYPVASDPFLALSREDTFCTIGTTNYTPHTFGSSKCESVSANSVIQSAERTLDYLFDVDNIPKTGNISSFNNRLKGL